MSESLLPPNTREHLYKAGSWRLPGSDESPCEGAKFHSPRPMFTEHVSLVKREWWPEDHPYATWVWAPKADLCGVCRDNLDILLQMLHATNGDLPWPVRREFGNVLRALAERGWAWFAERRPEVTDGPV